MKCQKTCQARQKECQKDCMVFQYMLKFCQIEMSGWGSIELMHFVYYFSFPLHHLVATRSQGLGRLKRILKDVPERSAPLRTSTDPTSFVPQ